MRLGNHRPRWGLRRPREGPAPTLASRSVCGPGTSRGIFPDGKKIQAVPREGSSGRNHRCPGLLLQSCLASLSLPPGGF